MVDNYRMST